jgi:Sec-independent protein secretion pathway component TatC
MVGLYFVGMAVSKVVVDRKKKREEAERAGGASQ